MRPSFEAERAAAVGRMRVVAAIAAGTLLCALLCARQAAAEGPIIVTPESDGWARLHFIVPEGPAASVCAIRLRGAKFVGKVNLKSVPRDPENPGTILVRAGRLRDRVVHLLTFTEPGCKGRYSWPSDRSAIIRRRR